MGWDYRYEGTVTATPPIACFGQPVTFTATARKVYTRGKHKGESEDVSGQLLWRNEPQGTGPVFVKVFESRRNTRVSVYIKEGDNDPWPIAGADVTVICCALGKPDTNDFTEDELYLARMIVGEASTCTTEEKVAIGYAAANRMRFDPKRFGSSVKSVVTRRRAFDGMETDLAQRSATAKDVRDLTYTECKKVGEALSLARSILADPDSSREPLFTNTGEHAFYFNKSRSDDERPDGELSPRIHDKGQLGFKHSFYTSKRKPR